MKIYLARIVGAAAGISLCAVLTGDWTGVGTAVYWFSAGVLLCYFLDRHRPTVSSGG